MRLRTEEKQALEAALQVVQNEVYLFGSRVDENKKGGDIDLLVFSQEDAYQLAQDISVRFFAECEEKLDVTVIDPDKMTEEQRVFVDSIHKVKIK